MNTADRTERILDVRDAQKRYGDFIALDGVSIHVDDGELVGLLGPNGAGKTTLLESIVGARTLESGTVVSCGIDVRSKRVKAVEHMTLQPQGSSLFKHLTVVESVRLWRDLYPNPLVCEDALTMVGLAEMGDKRVLHLSGGQQQRLRLALALVANTELVMFDEPTVGLDPLVREHVWDVIKERSRRGAGLLATQMMDEAEALCDRVIILDHGRIVCQGTVDALIAQYGYEGSISFTTQEQISTGHLQSLDGVVRASARRVAKIQSVRLITRDQVATRNAVTALLGVHARQYRKSPPTFSDVFLSVVDDPSTISVGAEAR